MEPDENTCDESGQSGLLQRAKAAATAGNATKMVEILMSSGYMPGLARRMQSRWPRLEPEDIDFAVSRGIETLYFKVRDGKQISDLHSYMWKVADRRAYERHIERRQEQSTDPDEITLISDARGGTEPSGTRGDDDEVMSRRRRAISVARNLLPRLGQESIQRVFTVVLDALEVDELHLSNADIADATSLSLETVRTSLSRGFRRLQRLAKEDGLIGEAADVVLTASVQAGTEVEP